MAENKNPPEKECEVKYRPPYPPAACPAPENEGDGHKTKPQSGWFKELKELISEGLSHFIGLETKLHPPDDALINAARTTVTIATPTRPGNPDMLATAVLPGYDRVFVYLDGQRISRKIWLINDGPGTLFAIASYNLVKWSGESEILVGETRAFFNVFELRVRSPDVSTRYRLTEYEPAISSPPNQPSFVASSVTPAAINTDTLLDTLLGATITAPDGFALVIRANPQNTGRVYISRTDATVVAQRNTLNAGDRARLNIVNTSVVHVAISVLTDRIDVLVEQ